MSDTTEKWHLSKSVSLSTIASIAVLAIALMTGWSNIQTSIDSNAKDIEHIRELHAIQAERTQELKSDISERLERFERKLDKLINRSQSDG